MFLRWKHRLQERSRTRWSRFDIDAGEYVNRFQEKVDGEWRKRVKPLGPLLNYTHRALLVESSRVDGKVRQRVVRYLGSIDDDTIVANTVGRGRFWQHIDEQLDGLALDEQTRERIVAAVLALVPRPDEQDFAQKDTERQQRLAGLMAMARM